MQLTNSAFSLHYANILNELKSQQANLPLTLSIILSTLSRSRSHRLWLQSTVASLLLVWEIDKMQSWRAQEGTGWFEADITVQKTTMEITDNVNILSESIFNVQAVMFYIFRGDEEGNLNSMVIFPYFDRVDHWWTVLVRAGYLLTLLNSLTVWLLSCRSCHRNQWKKIHI